jgi:hypothetical protein
VSGTPASEPIVRNTEPELRLPLAFLVALLVTAPAAARPLETGLTDPTEGAFAEADPPGAYATAAAAGARVIRVPVVWSTVAPSAPANAGDPADPVYRWGDLDRRVRAIDAAGMQPLLSVYSAPPFARLRGGVTPNASDLGAFAGALARRYAGDGTLPRVRRFQIWNEPNLKDYLDQSDAPVQYRAMLNAAYPAIHAVHGDNVVVGGGLGPFAGPNGRYGTPPLTFARRVLAGDVPFDVWAQHPYTSGPPARRALNPGDVSIGDLPKVRALLRSTGHARARLWVTEFSWDSGPPDPFAVPVAEHARWVAEGLYRMWHHGVSLVVWFQLRDNPKGSFSWGQTFQSGLYFRTTARYADERAKPALRAFRFPFVALPSGGRVTAWGRTPQSDRRTVVLERRAGTRWVRVTTVRADADGIFTRRLQGVTGQRLRARIGSDTSATFAARATRDRMVNPFGGSRMP